MGHDHLNKKEGKSAFVFEMESSNRSVCLF